ncbi:MAG: hypothetical protein II196_03280 [Spirochaetales bacterium]|nr:hypothetical protein [Spirochaetales bacterium]
MKKILFVLLAMAISLPGFANEVTAPETQEAANIETPSFSIENEDVAKVTEENKNEQTAFDMEVFEKNKKITTGLLCGSISASSVGLSILIASIVMGFIPNESFPRGMFTDVAFQIENVYSDGKVRMSSYPSMMVYCCVGATLFCVGTFIVLFALPIMFYSIVRKVTEYKAEKAMKKEDPHWEVSASGFQFRF